MNITTDCEKHGQAQRALPVIKGVVRPWTEWPKDVAKYPRVCVMQHGTL